MTFLLSEDKALRERLQGMVVHDQKADGADTPRQVGVWFGQPDQEIRAQNYPYITIDMIDVQRDTQREMRGIVAPSYLPTPAGLDPETQGVEVDMPIPVLITYQISTFARHPRHDREILSQLMVNRLPRFGYLEVIEKTETVGDVQTITSTYRRMDTISVVKRDSTEQAKRLFMNAITVRVSSELVQGRLRTIYKALEVHVDTPELMPVGMDSVRPSIIS
jgi:hypothetical protein